MTEINYHDLSADEFKRIIKRNRKKDTGMKLNYSSKRTITTADLFDACNPPLIFEVRTRPPRGWAKLQLEFDDSNHEDAKLAKQLISMAFLTVSDGENTYPIETVSQVEDLAQAIENENPGYGDEFLRTIAWGFSTNHYNYLGDHLGNSLEPLPQLNGSGQEEKVKVS